MSKEQIVIDNKAVTVEITRSLTGIGNLGNVGSGSAGGNAGGAGQQGGGASQQGGSTGGSDSGKK